MKIEYFNCFTHFVFTTFEREPMILESFRNRLEKYITGVIKNNSCKLYSIYANPEHMHILLSRAPMISEEYIATIIAESSQKFINDNNLLKGYFSWQQTASAFSVSKKDVDMVCKYILSQPEHHKKRSFAEEYSELVREFQTSNMKKLY